MRKYLIDAVISRKDYLEGLVHDTEIALEAAPEGTLRVSGGSRSIQYYHVNGPGDRKGKYLNQTRWDTVRALAQKDYDRKVLLSAKKELYWLKGLEGMQDSFAEDVYSLLSPARRALIAPIEIPDDEYVRSWLESKRCEPMGFGESDPVILTMEGYRVRSKSEQQWADAMKRLEVPHVFEPLLYLEGRGWVRPDFAGLNVHKRKEIYVEHFGMMDDPAYSDKNVDKLHIYERNGYVLGDSLLITMETKKHPLETKAIEELISRHFL